MGFVEGRTLASLILDIIFQILYAKAISSNLYFAQNLAL